LAKIHKDEIKFHKNALELALYILYNDMCGIFYTLLFWKNKNRATERLSPKERIRVK
jgi:hypothetical protein